VVITVIGMFDVRFRVGDEFDVCAVWKVLGNVGNPSILLASLFAQYSCAFFLLFC
jgi:hypothetical protein